jgi:hypothetical protein
MPSKLRIRAELDKLSIAYPYPERADAELDALAEMWAEDLDGMTDQELMARIRQHRKTSRWFPTVADIMSVEIEGHEPAAHRQLPERPSQMSDSERQKGQQEVRKILDRLCGQKSIKEG